MRYRYADILHHFKKINILTSLAGQIFTEKVQYENKES